MQQIQVGHLTFDCTSAGQQGDPLVLLLHGFPQTNHTWRHQLPVLANAGFFAVAPNQRGYSSGARPPDRTDYRTDHLVEDALGMASALGYDRFHLVGHDWGGHLSWLLAALHPDRVITLTVLSRPHPGAFVRAIKHDAKQSERSKHHRAFQKDDAVEQLLSNGAKRLRGMLGGWGGAKADVEAYLDVLIQPAALEAAVNWYRAGGSDALQPDKVPSISVPTLYLWGDADGTVGEMAATGTEAFVSGPYRFESLPGVGHFVTDQIVDGVNVPLLEHLGGYA